MNQHFKTALVLCGGAFLCLLCPGSAHAGAEQDWLKRFAFAPPEVSKEGIAQIVAGELPSFQAEPLHPGPQTVRVSLPLSPGRLAEGQGLLVKHNGATLLPDARVLTVHPGDPVWVRRILLTFPYDFEDTSPVPFALAATRSYAPQFLPSEGTLPFQAGIGGLGLSLDASRIEVTWEGKPAWAADLRAPAQVLATEGSVEIIESGPNYLWVRALLPDTQWPRSIELRADALGAIAVRCQLQRLETGNGTAPDFGWTLSLPSMDRIDMGEALPLSEAPVVGHFIDGHTLRMEGSGLAVSFPQGPGLKRGGVTARMTDTGAVVEYLAMTAAEEVPHQEGAWREASFVVSTGSANTVNALLEPALPVRLSASAYRGVYNETPSLELTPWPRLARLLDFHVESMASATLTGPDFGNVTTMPVSGVFGMNRLNHCPAIFHEFYRSGDGRLREAALQWCNNFHDLSLWWGGPGDATFGGTRYNNLAAMGQGFEADPAFMWRSNSAVHFCTKGYDSFLYAYEETGDPRMATALRWQVAYAAEIIHTDQGEARNIGDVLDFVRLYEATGRADFLEQALRLFRELRTRLSPGDLFSQGGERIVDQEPFMDDDSIGYLHPFAKPYIIGYALAGLPALARHAPDEEKLRDVIRAVADFLADSQDPTGGWRYPHPRSSRVLLGQAMEHAAQMTRAAVFLESRGEPIDNLLNAIERTLQARLAGWERSGGFLNGLSGWEVSTGAIPAGKTLHDLYQKPEDRPRERDYSEGGIDLGNNSPEGVVYFSEVLAFYLQHRPAERLFNVGPELSLVLDRIAPPSAAASMDSGYPDYGMEQGLPTFSPEQRARLSFPLAYDPERSPAFPAWREEARAKVIECLLTPPPRASFDPVVVATEDRGAYEVRKLVFSVSVDTRIPAYLLVPKREGPHPAIVALHDHGAHFSIGKEKVVRPFGVAEEVAADAQDWVDRHYGGRYICDTLAERGYVVLAMDALFWGERGRREGVDYHAQQRLAANLLQLGMTWSGVITWDDLRSAEFLSAQPEVDPARIGAVGLSMGSHRTWMLSALSDHIAAGAAICWMGDTKTLMAPGNNQTTGQSAYSMLVPNLRNFLDFPDVASIACPKPMLFYNGTEDALFPVPGVEASYTRMRKVWESQGASKDLETRLWPVPHEFNEEMQEAAFAWIAQRLQPVYSPK